MVYGEEVIRILPEKIANETKKFISDGTIQEIRIKVGKPIILILSNEEKVLNYVTTNDEVKGILVKISNYSLYAYEEEIKQGYITIKGGHRVGIAGECVISNGEIKTIKNISSLNIRISKAVVGDDTWGAPVHEEFTISGEENHKFKFIFGVDLEKNQG